MSAVATSALRLRAALDGLSFGPPVTCVYNPLDYAWDAHEEYLERYASGRKCVVFLGMNPGPFGMVQTGVPFGEVASVRNWLGISAPISQPAKVHPQRPVQGFGCQRSEISGQRLWGLFRSRYGSPHAFFAEHTVMNYCPLAFMEATGRNRTPEKLPAAERTALFAACDRHLRELVEILEPKWLIGVGRFAAERAERALSNGGSKVGCILHPSPASPAANKDWAAAVTAQLQALGVWA